MIGWHLDDTLADSLTITALRMALAQRQIRPGLVHHSDRGVQYASTDYMQLLGEHGIEISMSRKGNQQEETARIIPRDNGRASNVALFVYKRFIGGCSGGSLSRR